MLGCKLGSLQGALLGCWCQSQPGSSPWLLRSGCPGCFFSFRGTTNPSLIKPVSERWNSRQTWDRVPTGLPMAPSAGDRSQKGTPPSQTLAQAQKGQERHRQSLMSDSLVAGSGVIFIPQSPKRPSSGHEMSAIPVFHLGQTMRFSLLSDQFFFSRLFSRACSENGQGQ